MKETIFDFEENVQLRKEEIEEFFKINVGNKNKKMKSEIIHTEAETLSISDLLNNIRFTSIYVAVRNLNSKVKFNFLIKNFHLLFEDVESEDIQEEEIKKSDEIIKILLSNEILTAINAILITENEINLISSNIINLNRDDSLSDPEKWILKCYDCPDIKTLILILSNIFTIKSNLLDIIQSLESYIEIFSSIIQNRNLKLILNLILQIDNLLNSETGKITHPNFDVSCLDSICDLKYNSKGFLKFLFNIYIEQFDKENANSISKLKIFQNKESSIMTSLQDSYYSIDTIYMEIEKYKSSLLEDVEKLNKMIKNKIYLNKFCILLTNVDIQLQILFSKVEEERAMRLKFLKYFNFQPEEISQSLYVSNILKNLNIFGNKFQAYLKDLSFNNEKKLDDVSVKKLKNVKENPEKKKEFSQNKVNVTQNSYLFSRYKLK